MKSIVQCDGNVLNIQPDVQMDFRRMPFDEGTFRLVVWDPPHMKKLNDKTWMAQKFGVLSQSWEEDLKQGFSECIRVLKIEGILIFKWNEAQITLNKVLSLFPLKPLFGHTTGKHGRTIWVTFIKL